MQQVFLNEENIDKDIATITGEDALHLIRSVRIRKGERLRITSSSGDSFIGEVYSLEKDFLSVKLLEKASQTELNTKIYLFQAIPKGQRFDTIIEKTVELGVYEIIPVMERYCVTKWDDDKKDKKISRLQRIAKSAAEQSKRSIIPKVREAMDFKAAADLAREISGKVIVPYENESDIEKTDEALRSIKSGDVVSVFIGPEGGFSDDEISYIKEFSNTITLGKRILRTDTAAISALTLISYFSEMKG